MEETRVRRASEQLFDQCIEEDYVVFQQYDQYQYVEASSQSVILKVEFINWSSHRISLSVHSNYIYYCDSVPIIE